LVLFAYLAFREEPVEQCEWGAALAHVAVPQPLRGDVPKADQRHDTDASSDDTPCAVGCFAHRFLQCRW
jgi:hypothetical protein